MNQSPPSSTNNIQNTPTNSLKKTTSVDFSKFEQNEEIISSEEPQSSFYFIIIIEDKFLLTAFYEWSCEYFSKKIFQENEINIDVNINY